jgi:hypothetical protein
MQVPKNAGTNAKRAKPQATNSRSFRAGVSRSKETYIFHLMWKIETHIFLK